jgi:hypothetical protein
VDAWFSMTTQAVALLRPRRLALVATAATAIAGIAVIYAARWGPDWPAQEFRAWIAVHEGLSTWTARWYGGAALPGYSILYPPLAAVAGGAGGVGLIAVVVSSWAAAGLAPQGRARAVAYSGVVAISLVECLLIGEVPFLLGVALGVGAFRALVRERPAWTVFVLAVLSSLATPLTGAFLVLIMPACAAAISRRRSLALAGGLTGPGVAVTVGGAAGPFPMPWLLFVSMLAFVLLVLVLSPPEQRGLRVFALCYLLAAILLFVVPNPIGGNLARLGKLLAMPLACHFLTVDRLWLRTRAAVVFALAFLWPTAPFAGSIAHGADDPSRTGRFYSGLLDYLRQHDAGTGRVEIPFTREHWEAFWVAKQIPIARGWERQTDYRYNDVLYQPLTPAIFRRWLTSNAVDYVALPDVPIDVGGSAEARLLRNAPSYLEPVWHDVHWKVWRVRGATPLVTGPAVLRDLDPSSMDLHFRHAGTAEVRVRYDTLWQVSAGHGCVAGTPDGWIDVAASAPGDVELSAGLNGSLLTRGTSCRR